MEVALNPLIFWSTLIAGITFIIWVLFLKQSRFQKLVAKIPGPPGVWFFGNAFDLAKEHSETFIVLSKWFEQYRKFKIYKFTIGREIIVLLCKASCLESILSSSEHIEKSTDYRFLHPWLGNGLLLSTGSKWKSRRKLLTPAFHFRILEDFLSVFNEHSKVLIKQLSTKIDKQAFDIFPYITACTLDIICETAMGRHVNAQIEKESEYVKSLYKISEIIFGRSLSPWLHSDWSFRLSPMYREQTRCLKILHGFTKKVIQERKEELIKHKSSSVEIEEDALLGKRKRLAFLDLLVETSQDGKILSDEDIQEEVDTFMFEGHDTTSAGISSILYLLGRNHDHQLKVQQELDEVLGADDDQLITLQDLAKLKFLECVIKESLRLLPPVPSIARKLTKDVYIDNILIPAGVSIQIVPYSIHRDPEEFPDPEKFDPERFMTDNTAKRNPYAYIPFSAGPRNCIGQKFAMQEMKIVLVHFLRKYTVKSMQSMEELKLAVDLILRPRNGYHVILTTRKRD